IELHWHDEKRPTDAAVLVKGPQREETARRGVAEAGVQKDFDLIAVRIEHSAGSSKRNFVVEHCVAGLLVRELSLSWRGDLLAAGSAPSDDLEMRFTLAAVPCRHFLRAKLDNRHGVGMDGAHSGDLIAEITDRAAAAIA